WDIILGILTTCCNPVINSDRHNHRIKQWTKQKRKEHNNDIVSTERQGARGISVAIILSSLIFTDNSLLLRLGLTTLPLPRPRHEMVNNTPILPSRRRLSRNRPASWTSLPMEDKELMQRILQMIRNPHLQMTESRHLRSL